MEWKRKFIALPNRTIDGDWFMWKHVWCRPINNLSRKLEYALNPDNLEVKHGRITWEKWLHDSGWSDEPTKDAASKMPSTFNAALRLSLDSPTQHVKLQAKSNRPPPPPPASPGPVKGDVVYNNDLDIMQKFDGTRFQIMTAHEVRLELLRTQLADAGVQLPEGRILK